MIEQKLNELYEAYGYRKFKMSKFENYDLYSANRDFLDSSRVITFTDIDGTLMALKPDITLSIVKNDNGCEEKVYYNETVYRPKNGHYREIVQSGVEFLGTISTYSQAEVIFLAAESLKIISEKSILRLSDVAYINALFDSMDIDFPDRQRLLEILSMKNAGGVDELVREKRLKKEYAETLKTLIDMYLPLKKGIELLFELSPGDEGKAVAKDLMDIADVLESFGETNNICLDLSVTNNMDYYNGILMHGSVEGIPVNVVTGGRYDRLPQKMGMELGAIGFAVYIDAIEGMDPACREKDVDVLLTYTDRDDPRDIALAVKKFRQAGLTVRTASENDLNRMHRSIRAAERLNVSDTCRIKPGTEGKI